MRGAELIRSSYQVVKQHAPVWPWHWRRRNFGILVALGASGWQLGSILRSEGLMILVGGGVIGMAMGFGLAWMLVGNSDLGVGYIVLAGFCGALGNVFGSMISYWVGARGGLPFLKHCGKYILISNHDLEWANRWFDRYGDWITFAARFVPGDLYQFTSRNSQDEFSQIFFLRFLGLFHLVRSSSLRGLCSGAELE
jgi:hypothetical protein